MAIRFVRGAGNSVEPAVISLYASGVIHANSVVIVDSGANAAGIAVSGNIAGTGITTTNAFGVSLDYVQGASDTQVRVIPFVQGQIWEVDAANAILTTSVGLRLQMASDLVVRNTGSVSESVSTGVFLCLGVTGLTTGSGKLIGTFLQKVPWRGTDQANYTD